MANDPSPPSSTLDELFGALADPTRRAVVARLSQGPLTVKTLAAPFPMALPTFSRHLKVLEAAGLVARSVEGRFHHVSLADDGIQHVADWLQTVHGVPARPAALIPQLPAPIPVQTSAGSAREPLARAQALLQELRPHMAMVAEALAARERTPAFSPHEHRVRMLAAEAGNDPGLRQHLEDALGCFERLEQALVDARAETIKQAVMPLGHVRYAWTRHPLLRELLAGS